LIAQDDDGGFTGRARRSNIQDECAEQTTAEADAHALPDEDARRGRRWCGTEAGEDDDGARRPLAEAASGVNGKAA
jgi:hypothetical protein